MHERHIIPEGLMVSMIYWTNPIIITVVLYILRHILSQCESDKPVHIFKIYRLKDVKMLTSSLCLFTKFLLIP